MLTQDKWLLTLSLKKTIKTAHQTNSKTYQLVLGEWEKACFGESNYLTKTRNKNPTSFPSQTPPDSFSSSLLHHRNPFVLQRCTHVFFYLWFVLLVVVNFCILFAFAVCCFYLFIYFFNFGCVGLLVLWGFFCRCDFVLSCFSCCNVFSRLFVVSFVQFIYLLFVGGLFWLCFVGRGLDVGCLCVTAVEPRCGLLH